MTKLRNMNDLKGISGVLILVASGVTLSPFYMLSSFLEYPSLITGEDFSIASLAIKTLVWGEAIFFATMIFVTAYVAFLFFTKKREFPNWFIGVYLVFIAYNIVDASYYALLFPEESLRSSLGVILGQMIGAAIWILYILKSERVRLTFVED